MPDNTNVNNNASVVVVGRTAPVPPGQQKSEKSIPVVIATDQPTIPVAEQNKIQSEVALSLLGIPRSEVALGIFADVNTYDVNPSEWASTPEQYSVIPNTGPYTNVKQFMGWGLTHVPEESGALVEAPADKTAILTSKRFFRYQPGRVSAATFGVKTSEIDDSGATVQNPCIRKYGIFDNYDGYYWETRNDGSGDNLCVVRRTQSLIYENPIGFGTQTDDYGRTNPQDPFGIRGSESEGIDTGNAKYADGGNPKKFGDLVILRDNLLMTHAAVYDPSLLQDEYQVGITSVTSNVISLAGLAKTVTNAVYDISTGLMTITTSSAHGFKEGKYISLTGIGMTCYLNPTVPKIYPNRTAGYNILTVGTTTSFTINVGISTVPTFYHSGGYVLGLSATQHVSYSKGSNAAAIGGLTDTKIYKVVSVGVNTVTGISTVTISNLDNTSLNINNVTGISSHVLITPVPFVQPNDIGNYKRYGTAGIRSDGMFPYLYEDTLTGNKVGYIDTRNNVQGIFDSGTFKSEVDSINNYYNKWVNHNVKKEYWNVYEYRIPRSRFSGDRLDNKTDLLLYSDAISDKKPGDVVIDSDTLEQQEDTSIWDLDITKVTMYKIEFSWYGAVGALFLAYVPVSNGEARWVRVHHLRASNQLKVSSLGNATLPITYLVYGGGNENRYGYANSLRKESEFTYGSSSEHIVKYGASYYIDGGDRGTVKLFSYSSPVSKDVYGSKRTFTSSQVNLSNATDSTNPRITELNSSGISSSFYVGSKIITTSPLDQNIEISYISGNDVYLNSPLSSSSFNSIDVITNRQNVLFGLKCKDFIQSSTGKNVRNRTQVYPTRLSTASSSSVVKLDLIKTPIFQTSSTTSGSLSISSSVNIGKRGKPTAITSNNLSYLSPNTGTYGYFRGYFENDATKKYFAVLGYLENRGTTEGYYFYSVNSYPDNVILDFNYQFLKEGNYNSVGTSVSPVISEFTLSQLSSVKISPEVRSPIPNTGTVVASIFVPASGAEYDLSSYFDYNKEYLSFPLTDKIESLYLCVSSQSNYNAGSPATNVSASLTWEEQ